MAEHNVVETTNVSGRCFDFIFGSDLENGSIIAKGELSQGERCIYTAAVPSLTDEVFISADPVDEPYDAVRRINEDEYVIPAGKPFRAYGLNAKDHDRFAVLDIGISPAEENVPVAVGDYVGADGETTKLKDLGAQPDDTASRAFLGKIIDFDDLGFNISGGSAVIGRKYIIEVIKNETNMTAAAQEDEGGED